MPDPTPPDPYRLAALAVLDAAGVPLVWVGGLDGVEPVLDLDAAARQMRAELGAAEARGYARASAEGEAP